MDSDGSHVAIGSEYNDGNGENAGHVRIFTWDVSSWDLSYVTSCFSFGAYAPLLDANKPNPFIRLQILTEI